MCAVQLVRLKEDNTRVDERCSCCSLLIRASLEEGDLQAAQKHCVRAFTVLERYARLPVTNSTSQCHGHA